MLPILGEAALHTLVLAGVVQGILWMLRVRAAQLLLAAWTVVLVASMAMPLLVRLTPLHLPFNSALSTALMDGVVDLLQQSSLQAPLGDAVVEVQSHFAVGPWLEAAYVIVCCAVILRILLGVGLSFQMLARALPVRPEWAVGIRVRISRDILGPVTIGHVVVLPIDVVEWSAEMRHAVLAHERAHVVRRDFALLIASQLNRALFWFSPVSWWLHRQLVVLTELASDDQAIAATRDRLGYADILLEMGRRSGPFRRGPTMARLATLPQRIDRILLDQGLPERVGRSQQRLLTFGVASLSLAAASLAPGSVPNSATIMLAQQRAAQNDQVISRALPDGEAGDVIEQRTLVPQLALPATPGQFPAAGSLPRIPVRAVTKSKPVPGPRRASDRPIKVVTSPRVRETGSVTQAVSIMAIPSHAPGSEVASLIGDPAFDEAAPSFPQKISYRSLFTSTRLDFEAVVDSACTGTLTVGPGAWPTSSAAQQHDFSAGQLIPVQAQFFHKQNGTAWVRFNVSQRPPLDLPVRLTQSGMTWAGEHGITYAVQDVGKNHLVGLAAPIAHESARLELACVRSAHL